jgi:hypothetical protein
MVSPGVGDEVHCFEVDGELADDRVMKARHTSVVSVDVVSRPQGPAPAATPTIANSPTSSASSPRAASSSRNVANADNHVWSLYRAPWLQPVATSRKW